MRYSTDEIEKMIAELRRALSAGKAAITLLKTYVPAGEMPRQWADEALLMAADALAKTSDAEKLA